MRKIFISSGILALIVIAGCAARQSTRQTTVLLGGRTVAVSVADEPIELQRGLAGVESLSWDEGMLFVFDRPDSLVFWMKGMLISIDMVWIRGSRIVGIEKSVPAPDESQEAVDDAALPRYTSPEPVDRVLEVRAGFAERFGLSAGDTVEIEGLQGR